MLDDDAKKPSGVFPATRWTYIAQIRTGSQTEAEGAVEKLCLAYWYPLYVYARRFGLAEVDAKDTVQDVFAKLIEHNRFAQADASLGKLRSYLLTTLKHQISETRGRANAGKRGGGKVVLELDLTDAEGRYVHEVESKEVSPDRAFERKWAYELLRLTMLQLREAYAVDGKAALFETLSPALIEGRRWHGHERAAATLGMSEGTLRVTVHRLRDRFRQALLMEVGKTVEEGADVKTEVNYLMGLFSR